MSAGTKQNSGLKSCFKLIQLFFAIHSATLRGSSLLAHFPIFNTLIVFLILVFHFIFLYCCIGTKFFVLFAPNRRMAESF